MAYAGLEGFEEFSLNRQENRSKKEQKTLSSGYSGLEGFQEVDLNQFRKGKSSMEIPEEEGTLISSVRTALQAPLGYAKKFTWPADLAKFIGQTESLQEIEEYIQQLPELRKTFPQMEFPELDIEKYQQSFERSGKYFPTQENIERIVEESTGAPLQPRTRAQGLVRLGGEAAGFKEGGIKPKVFAGAIAPSLSKGLETLGMSENAADATSLLLSQPSYKSIGELDPKLDKLVSRAKNIGFTEREIAPLLQSPTKQKVFTKLMSKGAKTEKLTKDIYELLGKGYKDLENSEAFQVPLPQERFDYHLNQIDDLIAKEIPSELGNKIKGDLEQLIKSKGTAADFSNLHTDLNYYISKGDGKLGILKDPIQKAIYEAAPMEAENFYLTNELYSKFAPVRKKLKPTDLDKLITVGEVLGVSGGLISSAVTGSFMPIASVLGLPLARKFSQEMLTNPKLFNLANKFATSSIKTQRSIIKRIADEFDDIEPEIAKQLRSKDLEE